MMKINFIIKSILIIFTATIFYEFPRVNLPLAIAQDPCPCKERTPPVAYTGEIIEDGFNFTWSSDADQNPNDKSRYCYERIVKNNHQTNPLSFNWPLGRMSSTSGINPGGKSRRCQQYGDYKKPAQNGPIYYGIANKEAQTTVWEGIDEPPAKTKNPFHVTFEIDLFYRGRTQNIGLNFRSVATTGKIFNYEYGISNFGKAEVKFLWQSALSDKFRQAFTNLREVGTAEEIHLFPWSKPINITFTSEHPPIIRNESVQIIDSNGKIVAACVVPAYVPAK